MPQSTKEMRSPETWQKLSQLVARTWSDPGLKQRLMDNPTQVLQEYGIPLPPGGKVVVVDSDTKVIVLPERPEAEITSLSAKGGGQETWGGCFHNWNAQVGMK